MGHHHHGHAIGRQSLHHLQHFTHHLRIEGAGWFIKEQDAGLHAEGAGYGNPLLLAAGELAGKLMGLLGNADPLQQGHRLVQHLPFGAFAHQDRCQGEVIEYGEMGEQVELLEYHPHLAPNRIDLA